MSNAHTPRKRADKLMAEAGAIFDRIPMGQGIVSVADRNRRERAHEKILKASYLYDEAAALDNGK